MSLEAVPQLTKQKIYFQSRFHSTHIKCPVRAVLELSILIGVFRFILTTPRQWILFFFREYFLRAKVNSGRAQG